MKEKDNKNKATKDFRTYEEPRGIAPVSTILMKCPNPECDYQIMTNQKGERCIKCYSELIKVKSNLHLIPEVICCPIVFCIRPNNIHCLPFIFDPFWVQLKLVCSIPFTDWMKVRHIMDLVPWAPRVLGIPESNATSFIVHIIIPIVTRKSPLGSAKS